MLSITMALLGSGEQKYYAYSSDEGATVLISPAAPYETNVDSC